jgi:putative methionine-R-sulfoxide reductase with GAF domain
MNWKSDDSPDELIAGLVLCARDAGGSRADRMRTVTDALWDALAPRGVSWIGFYEIAGSGNDQGVEAGEAMLLGPHRDKPACSPIGMHGACGQAFASKTTLIVTDVANLGEGYVACDPRDLSELVIPCLDEDGNAWGVLDADSFERGCFDERDASALRRVLLGAGLTSGDAAAVRVI